MESETAGNAGTRAPSIPTTIELLDAFSQELNSVRREVYQLQSRLSRYDRIFESAFKEELDRRVRGKDDSCEQACSVSPLDRLRFQAARGR